MVDRGGKSRLDALNIGRDLGSVLDHEAIHALKAFGLFIKAEWETLTRAALADTDRMARLDRTHGDLSREERIDEAIADMFRDWRPARCRSGAPSRRRSARIQRFFAALRLKLAGQGFTASDAVFRRVAKGKIGARGRDAQGRFAKAGSEVASRTPGTGLPVTTLKGDELGSRLAHQELHDATIEWYRSTLVGTRVRNRATGWEISFSGATAKETVRTKHDDLLRIIPALREILEHGTLVGKPEPDRRRRRNVRAFHTLAATVELDSRPRRDREDPRADGRPFSVRDREG